MFIQQTKINSSKRFLDNLPKNIQKIKIIYSLKDKENELAKIGFSSNPNDGNSILPSMIGKQSLFNAEGKKVIRKDLPKEKRSVQQRLHHWKQWAGKGQNISKSKIVDITKECYKFDFINPPSIEFIYHDNMIISESYKRTDHEKVKNVINLFLEFFGKCQIVKDDLSKIIKVKRVNWTLLPSGKDPWDRVKKYLTACNVKDNDTGFPILDRQQFFSGASPKEIVVGTAGFRGYLAYTFNKHTILDSINYGNAIYIFENKKSDFAKLTKEQILFNGLNKDRVIHLKGWKEKVKQYLK